jgi:pimeloyl-ACP methyl ester carboxylesterase
MMRPVKERSEEIDGTNVFWREAPAKGGAAPVLYVHGVPNHGGMWEPFLERTGGYAPDLPGFGRSEKPQHFDYSIAGYARTLHAYVDSLGLDRFSLVVHDWGAVGLALAQAIPERIERVVIMSAVPLLPGYRWHKRAKVWRTPLAGELMMGFTFKFAMRRDSRGWLADPGPAPEELIDSIYEHFDHGTQRAILKLYRSAPPDTLAAAGARLSAIKAPGLVLWGADDPYISPDFAQRYADGLGGPAEADVVEGAGHWLWLDRPELVGRVADFAAAGRR